MQMMHILSASFYSFSFVELIVAVTVKHLQMATDWKIFLLLMTIRQLQLLICLILLVIIETRSVHRAITCGPSIAALAFHF